MCNYSKFLKRHALGRQSNSDPLQVLVAKRAINNRDEVAQSLLGRQNAKIHYGVEGGVGARRD